MNLAHSSRALRLTQYLRRALKSHFAFAANPSCEASLRSPSKAGRGLVGAAVVVGGLLSLCSAQAQVRLWTPTSNDWRTDANWNLPNQPDTATESARFTTAAFVNPTITFNATKITIDSLIYDGPTAFTITLLDDAMNIVGGGVVNNSGALQTLNNNLANGTVTFGVNATAGKNFVVNNNAAFSTLQFTGSAVGGSATFNNLDQFAQVLFLDTSSGGSSLTNNIGQFSVVQGSQNSTLGNATVVNTGSDSGVILIDSSNGGTARVVNQGVNSFFDISGLATSGTTVGSIEGVGFVTLGNKNLVVGAGRDTVFAGVIQGIGGSLNVDNGTLRLTGINTYTGNTIVQRGGNLYVNGSIASPSTFVNHGGLLGGTGTIFGNVYNHGVVKPGNSPGTLHVAGSYTQYSDGDLRIEIASKTNYGRLQVGTVANLDGTVTAVAVNGFKPKKGDKFTVLTANGGVNGEFDRVRSNLPTNTILQLEATYKSNAVILEYQRGSFLDFAKTYNQRAVARVLNSASAENKEDGILNYLDGRQVTQLPNDFDRIAPEELAAAPEVTISYANVHASNIARHNDDIRNGTNGMTASGLSVQGNTIGYSGPISFRTGAAGPSGKESKDVKEIAPEENRWGAFVTGVGEWVDVSGDGNARGYDINTGGFTVGLDYKLTPNFALGVSAGYTGSAADLTNNGRIWTNGGKLGVYATYFTGGFYADAAVTGGYNSYSTKRGGLAGTARGDTDGGEISSMFATGYDIKSGGWSFGPTANVQYTYVGIDGFTEHGSLAPLHVQSQEQESLRTAIGFRASYDIKLRGGGIIIRPEVRTAWQHEFADDAYTIEARLRSGAGSVFSVDGPDMGRDSLLLGAGVVVLFGDRIATYLYYDGQLARTNYESNTITGGVRISF